MQYLKLFELFVILGILIPVKLIKDMEWPLTNYAEGRVVLGTLIGCSITFIILLIVTDGYLF